MMECEETADVESTYGLIRRLTDSATTVTIAEED
jgi:hypothetical protein